MGVGLKRAVFLDRDGVLNRASLRDGKAKPPLTLADLQILPGVKEALARLDAAGFDLVVVTNQPDVARGLFPKATVEAINAALAAELPLDEFRVCYHDDADGCDCRKPAPGLLLAAARERGLDLSASFMVGDRWRDVEAAQRAGCTPVFIDYAYPERPPTGHFVRVKSLTEAADFILGTDSGDTE